MHITRFLLSLIFAAVTVSCLFPARQAAAANVVTLAAGERAPYIGKGLPENGYVSELVTEAFKRRGYQVKIDFYPWARTQQLASEGKVDGLLPVFREEDQVRNPGFVYSNPLPGDTIGFLKKKSLLFSYTKAGLEKPGAFLDSLKGYRVGMVRGGVSLPFLENNKSIVKEMGSNDIQNLDKLALDRVQLSLIDKYTAADLMAGQRPHLIGQFEFMTPPLAQRDFFIGFSPKSANYQQLVTAFNEGLEEVTRDGTLLAILKKHGFFPEQKATQKKVRLTIGTVNNNDMKVMQNLSKEFEKQHPNIELEWRVLDENTLRVRLLSDLAISDGQFDVMTIGTYEAPIWAKQGFEQST
jgi:sorbitol/mannitol transport system substrate-binding protein